MRRTTGASPLTCALVLILPTFETATGKVLEETYRKWVQYKGNCVTMIQKEPLLQGLFCNGTFDLYACWPHTPAGTMVNISCPFYLPWYEEVAQGVVRRQCGADGLWETNDRGQVWRDMSQCEEEKDVTSQEQSFKEMMICFRTIYTVGYSFSLFFLVTALVILLSFRRLWCTRNFIHANLFLSFILRAVAIIVKDAMVDRHWGKEIVKTTDAAIGCRIAQVMMQYFVLANHCWFFGEAVYLHSLLIASVFTENNRHLLYVGVGWGTPLLFVVPWVAVKMLKENEECWAANENMNYWWIIRFPVLFASLVNFLIFVKILKVIFTKLRANNPTRYPNYKLRLAKATLTLIPLVGIHEVIFIFATDEQTSGLLRYIKVFFSLFMSSFQGFMVALLYCYANKEVQEELKRKLRSCGIQTENTCCGQ